MIKKIVHRVLQRTGYRLVKSSSIPDTEENQKNRVIEEGKLIIRTISPDFKVLNGPFKGIKYPNIDITEATLVPKIVGSYEAHLNPLIYQIMKMPYTDILDIGSAEGYYAVGFARNMPNTTIHCFDINEKDIAFCQAMAKLNNVNNLTYNKWCAPETLINFNFKGRALIFCDCEGYELELFTPEVISKLNNVDVLVELHDIANPVISATILERFQKTHIFQVINNLNVGYPNLSGLESLSQQDKDFAVFEHRGGYYQNIFMEWAFLTPR